MYIRGLTPITTVNGPGRRALIHVQGCYLNCTGCWNPDTHEFGKGEDTPTYTLLHWLSDIKGIEGVTFSGGEPLQSGDLPHLLSLIRTELPQLSIGLFTGYSLQELQWSAWRPLRVYLPVEGLPDFFHAHPDWWERIRMHLDFAIMGRYNQRMHTQAKALCGSSNQTIELFSDRYKLADFEQQAAEITISPDGQLVNITGFPASHGKLKEGLCEEQATSLPYMSP